MALMVSLMMTFAGCTLFSGEGTKPKSPEETAFREADKLIDAYKNMAGFGNNQTTRVIAKEFAELINKADKECFTGHKKRSVSLTNENFLTYVQESPSGTLFMVHVPQLKRYKGDVRLALTRLCWECAKVVCQKHGHKPSTLCVALRGSLLYGGMAIGSFNSENPNIDDSGPRTEQLYKYFKS